jgi:hypothetical protein
MSPWQIARVNTNSTKPADLNYLLPRQSGCHRAPPAKVR